MPLLTVLGKYTRFALLAHGKTKPVLGRFATELARATSTWNILVEKGFGCSGAFLLLGVRIGPDRLAFARNVMADWCIYTLRSGKKKSLLS